ncbi:MAG: hypothetical protein AB7S81_04175 [Bdellovibrionales bacterium]
MKQNTHRVRMSAPTESQKAGRSLTVRSIIHCVSAVACLSGILIACLSADPLAGQDLMQLAGGAVLTGVGLLGLILSGKPEEPSGPKRNRHKDATRASSTKMIDGGVMTPITTLSNPNNHNKDGRKIADNHARLRTQNKVIMSNIPH